MMNFKKYFAYAEKAGFSDVEFKVLASRKLTIGSFRRKIEKYEIADVETYSVRGIFNGRMTSGTTENKAGLFELIDRMAANASLIETEKDQQLFAGSPKYRRKKTYSDALAKVSAEDKMNMMLSLEEKCYAYDPRIVDVQRCMYVETEEAMTIVNSKGLKLNSRTSMGAVMCGAVAREDGDTRTGMEFVMGQKMDDFDLDAIAKSACDGALKALHGDQCRSGKYRTILHNDIFADLLRIWLSAVDGENVNKGKSMLKDCLEKPAASAKLTITEDPFTNEYPFMARTFDDEGVATSKKTIVDKGILKTFLYSMESAKEAGTESTGNGYGKGSIHTGTSCVIVRPGRKDLDQLALSIRKGVLITSVAGMHSGMNPVSGNFSLQANGYMIENGRITTPLHLITVAGNLYDMFRDIREVGNDVKLASFGIAAPSVTVGSLAISGK